MVAGSATIRFLYLWGRDSVANAPKAGDRERLTLLIQNCPTKEPGFHNVDRAGMILTRTILGAARGLAPVKDESSA